MNKRPHPLPRPPVLNHIPDEKLKNPTNRYERILFFGQKVYKQLTLTRTRMLVVGAFPFVAYISTSFIEYQRRRYEYRLQQSTFFKNSIAAIANSKEIRDTYGNNIKLKRASFWTVSSGFVPWIRERHVWLGFSGNSREGWLRMGLRRTDFKLNKAVYKTLEHQIDNELTHTLKEIMGRANETSDVTPEGETSQDETISPSKDDLIDSTGQDVKASSSDGTGENTEAINQEPGGNNASKAGDTDKKVEDMTSREIIERQLLAKEVKDKINLDQSKEYLKKVQTLYPQLSKDFSQNDLEQAIALRKDRVLRGKAFDKTWDLLSLSIHPNSSTDGVPVYVLYDPEDSYTDQGDYVFDSSFISIKRREAKQTEVIKREIPAQ